MNTTFIYALIDPRSLECRYVGKANNPYERYCQHLIDKYPCHKTNWIKSLLNNGLNPILQILEQCDISIWEERERDWIAFEKKIGCNLTNGTKGGEGVNSGPLSENHKRKISEIHKGMHPSDKTRLKLIESHKGKHPSEETRKKMSENGGHRIGTHPSEETRRKLIESHKGKRFSKETCQKISNGNKGKHRSDETKRKLSESHIGKIGGMKGKHHSEETKQKMKGKIPWNKGKTGLYHHSEEIKSKMRKPHINKHSF
jgi:hypothetical protein